MDLIKQYKQFIQKLKFNDVLFIKLEEDTQLALTEFNDIWGQKYPHISQS
jgi:hypothetical protein